jgi:hypothetical protein
MVAMGRKFTLDGKEYDTDSVTQEARDLVNQQALLIRARNAYILDLKTEIEGRAPGKVDASALLVSE